MSRFLEHGADRKFKVCRDLVYTMADELCGSLAQSGRFAVKRPGHRIEQGGLSGAGGPNDREKIKVRKIDLSTFREAREAFDRQFNRHG